MVLVTDEVGGDTKIDDDICVRSSNIIDRFPVVGVADICKSDAKFGRIENESEPADMRNGARVLLDGSVVVDNDSVLEESGNRNRSIVRHLSRAVMV